MTMGQRICIMKDGHIVPVGPPLEVYRNPANIFVAGFLASPPMNLLAGRLDGEGGLSAALDGASIRMPERSAARRAGNERVGTCRARWSPRRDTKKDDTRQNDWYSSYI